MSRMSRTLVNSIFADIAINMKDSNKGDFETLYLIQSVFNNEFDELDKIEKEVCDE